MSSDDEMCSILTPCLSLSLRASFLASLKYHLYIFLYHRLDSDRSLYLV